MKKVFVLLFAAAVFLSHGQLYAAEQLNCPFGGFFREESLAPELVFKYPSERTLGVCGSPLNSTSYSSGYKPDEIKKLGAEGIEVFSGFTIEDLGPHTTSKPDRKEGILEFWGEVDAVQIKVDPKLGIQLIETQNKRPLFIRSYRCDKDKCFKNELECSRKNYPANPFPGIVKDARAMMERRANRDFSVVQKLVDQALGGDREAFYLLTSEDFQYKSGFVNGDSITGLRTQIKQAKELGCMEIPAPPVVAIQCGNAHHDRMKAAFVLKEKWTGVKKEEQSELSELDWTLVDDGKSIGLLRTTDASAPAVVAKLKTIDERQQRLLKIFKENDSNGEIPSTTFIGSNLKSISDPEKWKRAVPPESIISSLKNEYLKKFPRKLKCKKSGPENNDAEYETTNDSLVASQILVNNRSFKSAHGWWLVGLENEFGAQARRKNSTACVGIESFPSTPHYERVIWFATNGSKINVVEDKNWDARNSYFPIEAADFDNDGRTEWLFMSTTYNSRIYTLASDDFQQFTTISGD